MVDQYDHFRASATAPVPPGIYRVVGTGEEVVLLRVTDADGHREHTGEVVTVSRSQIETAFEPADDPDTGFGVGDVIDGLRSNVEAVAYWLGL